MEPSKRDLVLSCILNKLPHFKRVYCKFPTDIEIFSNNLIESINEFCQNCLEVNEDYSLFFDEDESMCELNNELTFNKSCDNSENMPSTSKKAKLDLIEEFEISNSKNLPLESFYSFERLQEIAEMCDQKGRTRKGVASSLHKTVSEIDAICKRVKLGPSYEYKMIQLKPMLKSKFNEGRSMGLIIKDDTLKRWVCQIKHQLNFKKVDCSNYFVDSFKKENKIVSRRITHFITKKKLENHDNLVKSSLEFVQKINLLIDNNEYMSSNIYNADQSKIEYEMTTKRTLNEQGEKDIHASIINSNAMTHSFTIEVIFYSFF
jgi:hypothetical protein